MIGRTPVVESTDLHGGARLRVALPPSPPSAAVLVLHGGREASREPVRNRHLAVLRMIPFARSLRAGGRSIGLAVARLRYGVRGWNGEARSPVADAAAALALLAGRFPGTPIALVGHSMGGRTAVHIAGHAAVRTVIALAPWLTDTDPRDTVHGRRLLLVHGCDDRVTDPAASAAYAAAVRPVAATCCWVGVRGEGHALLRHAQLVDALVTGFVVGTLGPASGRPDRAPDTGRREPAPGRHDGLVRRALAGDAHVLT